MNETSALFSRPARRTAPRSGSVSFYVWTAIVLAAAVAIVVVSWHAAGGTADPTDLPAGHRLSHTTVVLNSAILVYGSSHSTIHQST